MNHRRLRAATYLGCLILALSVVGAAAAQTTSVAATTAAVQRDSDPFSVRARNRIPWSVGVGAYFGDKSVTFFDGMGNEFSESPSVGAEATFGYRYAFEGGEVRVQNRWSVFNVNVSDGSSFTTSLNGAEFSIFYRNHGFYIGPGVDILTATISSGFYSLNSNTEALIAGTVGYDFTPRVFVEAHYHASGTPALSGGAITVGYRF